LQLLPGIALGLIDHVPAARQAESWLYQHTAAGRTLHNAQRRIRESGADRLTWFYLIPVVQQAAE
jgi:hypothetical protein